MRLSVKEVLLYPGNNRHQQRAPHATQFSFKHVELARTSDGTRRLFRAEINGKVTGFVEKHYKGETLAREFALGGPRNGIDEAMATARFNGVDIKPASKPAPALVTAKPTTTEGLLAFITQSEPMMAGKSARPKPTTPVVSKVAPAPKPRSVRSADPKPLSRKQGLELAGTLLRTR